MSHEDVVRRLAEAEEEVRRLRAIVTVTASHDLVDTLNAMLRNRMGPLLGSLSGDGSPGSFIVGSSWEKPKFQALLKELRSK
jgi:hypothetical protein